MPRKTAVVKPPREVELGGDFLVLGMIVFHTDYRGLRVALLDLAHDRGDPHEVSRRISDSNERDIKLHPRAILPKALDVKYVVWAIVKHPISHSAPVIAPMIGALLHRNDKIERLPNHIICSVAKNALGDYVPFADYAVAIRRDDCMWAGRERRSRNAFFAY